jgi:uncharacterized protein involved in exopolysaccharide biosynthesis
MSTVDATMATVDSTIELERRGTAPATGPSVEHEESVSLKTVLKILWGRRWFIMILTSVLTAGTAGVSLLVEKQYEATVIISPVSEDTAGGRLGGLGSLMSQFGGLGAIAGLSGLGGERKQESLAILQSEALTERFIRENNLLPILFADKWDAAGHRWRITDAKKMPTLWKGNEFFKKHVRKVFNDTKTGLSTVTITWNDPKLATQWANDLVAMANDTIRSHTIEEAERNVTYLNQQLAKTNLVAVQNSVSTLLEGEIKKIMLAQGSKEYAFRVIDPAVMPERASFPNRTVWTLLGCLAGLIGSSAIVLSGAGSAKRNVQ